MLTAIRQVEEETEQIIGLHHILPLQTNSNLAKNIENEHAYCKVKVPSEEVVFESSQSDVASKDINLPSIQPEVHVFNAPAPSADKSEMNAKVSSGNYSSRKMKRQT